MISETSTVYLKFNFLVITLSVKGSYKLWTVNLKNRTIVLFLNKITV